MERMHIESKDGKIIIDACEIGGGNIEVMAMRSDGEEIDSIRLYGSETELAKYYFDKFRKEYLRSPLTGRYLKLKSAVMEAIAAGRAAEDNESVDSGTCNFDSPILTLQRYDSEKVLQAFREAGTRGYVSTYWGQRVFFVHPDTRSQGYPRTLNAEAMAKKLQEFGYDCGVWYQMD